MTSAQEKKIINKIRNELKDCRFGCYNGDNEWMWYDYKDFTSYCRGLLILSIGDGQFNSQLSVVIQLSMAYGEYQTAYHRRLEELGFKSS